MATLDAIETIVIVMMENRSFDNVLGHLHHPRYGNRPEVEGLKNPANTFEYDNFFQNQVYKPVGTDDRHLPHDLPHERETIATQLDVIGGQPTMGGFVQAYVDKTQSIVKKPPPLGFLTPQWVPISGFFAEEYLICNRWFSPLPAGTQPNRAVAFTGSSLIENNVLGVIPHEQLVFDWLNDYNVRWRVYHSGISFFLLFGCFEEAVGEHFHSIRRLAQQVQAEAPHEAPQVVFIEPEYGDSPIHFGYAPNDNHPPLPMAPGEVFLRDVYTALTSNPEKWAKTLLIVTYDEHGGFFDHVSPPAVRMDPPAGAAFTQPFETLGVRVPTLIASPWVPRRSVHDGLFDHTSILQLLGEKFAGSPRAFSAEVNKRIDQGIESASLLLTLDESRADVPRPPAGPVRSASVVRSEMPAAATENQVAFNAVARELVARAGVLALDRFPELAMLPPEDGG